MSLPNDSKPKRPRPYLLCIHMVEPQVAALAEALRVAGLPEEGDELRRGVVEQVEKLVVQWVAQVGVAGGLSEEQATTAGAKLLLLGS